ncbi:class I SAM-dependent methyltransferase [Acetobacteraceae bacterium KSS8]|uniref:Class I SAM-dependent methyltransferase n=1 Tax=Endosaccharibacter trunci TaxID=2812733 RepID=A0ABT1W8M7_9PROT|nr:class I SAM-dependent methyltransferase [Acetobacteraceae bacterium KSS8]
MSITLLPRSVSLADAMPEEGRAYDAVGGRYLAYADGDPERVFDFSGRYGFADGRIWSAIDAVLVSMVTAGRRSLNVLDVGCGPGTWIRRVVLRASELGFSRIRVRGFDLSQAMVGRAAATAEELRRALPRGAAFVSIQHGDAAQPFPEETGSVDLCLCLYGVLNHLPKDALPGTAAELARVTAGHLLVTVRAAGSLPTIYVDGIEQAARFHQDNQQDRMEVDLADGRHLSFRSHLFRAAEMGALFAPHLGRFSLHGLDLFHSRFAADPRWNPASLATDAAFKDRLEKLELSCADDPAFLDRAAHILLDGSRARH